MATNRRYTVRYNRKRKGKTDYKKRLQLLLSKNHRIVIRKSLKNISIQMIQYDSQGDKILISAHSKELAKIGWKASLNNLPACYLTGLLFGTKAKKKNINEGIIDLGFNTSIKGCKIYAALKGIIDAGLKVPHSKEVLPSEERTKGEHIATYSKENSAVFTDKNKVNPTEIPQHFEQIKKKILEGTK